MARNKRVIWAPQATQDLLDVWRYYALAASPDIADNILRGIERSGEAIGRNLLKRRPREDLIPGICSVPVSPHTIFYRADGGEVEIVRVLYEGRDFPVAFGLHSSSETEEKSK